MRWLPVKFSRYLCIPVHTPFRKRYTSPRYYYMRCLIVDSMHPSITGLLADAGVQAEYRPGITRAEVLAEITGYEGIIIRSKTRLDREFFQAATRLKFIARAGAGLDGIDLAEAAKAGVQIINSPEANRDAVAEHTLGLLLTLTNHIQKGYVQIRDGIWDREGNRGTEIMGKTFAIIGYGNMGQAVARRLAGFGCSVIAYDKYLDRLPDANARQVSLEEVYAEADIVSLHVPLTRETRGWVDSRFLGSFRKPIWLLNTARGEILPLADLLYCLDNGQVVAAGLDVLENERFDQLLTPERAVLQALAATGRVVMTPHVAGWSKESYLKINEVLVRKIKRQVLTSSE